MLDVGGPLTTPGDAARPLVQLRDLQVGFRTAQVERGAGAQLLPGGAHRASGTCDFTTRDTTAPPDEAIATTSTWVSGESSPEEMKFTVTGQSVASRSLKISRARSSASPGRSSVTSSRSIRGREVGRHDDMEAGFRRTARGPHPDDSRHHGTKGRNAHQRAGIRRHAVHPRHFH